MNAVRVDEKSPFKCLIINDNCLSVHEVHLIVSLKQKGEKIDTVWLKEKIISNRHCYTRTQTGWTKRNQTTP